MSDIATDIVERLRFHGTPISETADQMQLRKRKEREEAADEIERLRAEKAQIVAWLRANDHLLADPGDIELLAAKIESGEHTR